MGKENERETISKCWEKVREKLLGRVERERYINYWEGWRERVNGRETNGR